MKHYKKIGEILDGLDIPEAPKDEVDVEVETGREPELSLSTDQVSALDQIEKGDGPHCLLGGAGTGKSFLIGHMHRRFSPYRTASTGVASQNIKGSTLHSLLGMGPQSYEPKYDGVVKRMTGHDAVILDEVSMTNSVMYDHLRDALYWVDNDRANEALKFNRTIPPKIKLVMVGDFMQLPPVEGKFAFKSSQWKDVNLIKLTTQHRQEDPEFIAALYDLRVGRDTQGLRDMVLSRSSYYAPKDCTQLAAKRGMVKTVNDAQLAELPGSVRAHEWKYDIRSKYLTVPMLEHRCRYPSLLRIKEGARIVMLNNNRDSGWSNGSTGKVLSIEENAITVDLDVGGEKVVGVHEEKVYDGNKTTIAVVWQYPMMLAFALTIHKSQGMTLDRVAIDLQDHFACGQTYVALSRCRTKEGLFLFGNYKYIRPNLEALQICG